jgi:hypothetical protein
VLLSGHDIGERLRPNKDVPQKILRLAAKGSGISQEVLRPSSGALI